MIPTEILQEIGWTDIIDIIVVAYVLYRIFLLIRGTRAVQMLLGLFILMVAYFAAQWVGFRATSWVLQGFWAISILAVIVLFQPEFRRGLAQVGRHRIFETVYRMEQADLIDRVVRSCIAFASRRVGAIIVFERETRLENYIEAGTILNARVSRELLSSIFNTHSPIHDGAVIISQGELFIAGCFLPLSINPSLDQEAGTRHRAAIGITEETDAVAVVVSEERGAISLAVEGEIEVGLDAIKLRNKLERLLEPPKKESWWERFIKQKEQAN
jgi:diadenylate cyclase